MTKRQSRLLEYLVVVLIIGVVLALLRPVVSDREPFHREHCRSRLTRLGLALQNYHDVYGAFPPAWLADANGQPLHSWRVLLLPFLGHQDIYDAYRFDEPWNGPNNAELQEKVARELGDVLSCSSDWKNMKQAASYLAVVGPHAAWAGGQSFRKGIDFSDGPANTILVVEVNDSGIAWFEPRDLEIDGMCFGINDPSNCGIRSQHRHNTYWTYSIKSKFAHVIYADGSVAELPDTTPPRIVRALLTRDGGEEVPGR
ncbi:MAG: DUF1559 domain-containing protein [Planctomycetia bacterium]|nr:DUF1559 domain-containing protein [Planctomycetia bacterium]